MRDYLQDIRFGLRMMLKTPVVAAVAVISLAAGICANTTTFAVANGFLLTPFPYEDPDELVMLWELHRSDDDERPVSPANYLDYRERATGFEDLVAYDVIPANLTGGDQPERVQLVPMNPETFALLGREPFLGRDFEPGEGVPGAGRVAILSYRFWQRYFGANRSIVGEVVRIDSEPHTIIGVMPEAFGFIPADVDVFRPTNWESRREDRATRSLLVMGRLEDGRSLEDAQAEVSLLARQLAEEFPEANEGYGAQVMSLNDWFPGQTDTLLMYVLSTVAGFVLLIACANVGNLLLARAESRQREVAVRTALGAGRSRILRQLLLESVLLALVGGTIGTIASIYTIRAVAGTMPAMLPKTFLPELDTTVLVYTLGISVVAGMIFGIAPALHSFGDDIREALGDTTRGGTSSRKRNRLRSTFVVAEIAAALALLVGGGVLMNVFDELIMAGAGFDTRGIVTAQLTVSEDRYPEDDDVLRFQRELMRELEELPGVQSLAAMIDLPRSRGVANTDFTVDGRPDPRHNERPRSDWQSVSASYFDALGVPILSGRTFRESDRADTEPVVVVNEGFAEKFFPDDDPVGERITVFDRSRRIVGISRNIFHDRLPAEDGEIEPVLYLPNEQRPWRNVSLALRVEGDPSSYGDRLRSAVWAIDPEQPVSSIQTLDQHIANELSGPQVISLVLGIFGMTALLLSALGIYGVMAHDVAQRRRELGIRMALGAARRDVIGLVTRQGMRLAGLGFLIGAPLAYLLIRAIQSMLFTLDVVDPVLVGMVTAVLLAVAFTATYVPALRASRVPPVSVLHAE